MSSKAHTLIKSVLIVAVISFLNLFNAHAESFDGLKVFFCGTGGPLASSGRAQPCTAIQAGDALYLVALPPMHCSFEHG